MRAPGRLPGSNWRESRDPLPRAPGGVIERCPQRSGRHSGRAREVPLLLMGSRTCPRRSWQPGKTHCARPSFCGPAVSDPIHPSTRTFRRAWLGERWASNTFRESEEYPDTDSLPAVFVVEKHGGMPCRGMVLERVPSQAGPIDVPLGRLEVSETELRRRLVETLISAGLRPSRRRRPFFSRGRRTSSKLLACD